MTHSYTTNQIIKYLYQELPLTDHLETEYAISSSSDWNATYSLLKDALTALPKVQFFPKGRVVRSILSYSAEGNI